MSKTNWSADDDETESVLQRARDIFARHGHALARHPRIPGLLADYRKAIDLTSRSTISLGVPAFCLACALRNRVCCFQGVEHKYDEYLLLVNMLLGDLGNWVVGNGATCRFCGAQGCTLVAKHSFCLNFYCAEIKQGLGSAAMSVLDKQVGAELSCQWELERVLMPWLWAAK